jgi:hypothetical protein
MRLDLSPNNFTLSLNGNSLADQAIARVTVRLHETALD